MRRKPDDAVGNMRTLGALQETAWRRRERLLLMEHKHLLQHSPHPVYIGSARCHDVSLAEEQGTCVVHASEQRSVSEQIPIAANPEIELARHSGFHGPHAPAIEHRDQTWAPAPT